MTLSVQITVLDVVPPSITSCPPSVSLNVTPTLNGTVRTYTAPTAFDNADGVIVSNRVPNVGLASGDLFPVGVTNVVFVMSDRAGNNASCAFRVNVTGEMDARYYCFRALIVPTDVAPPEISACPSRISRTASSTSVVQIAWPAPSGFDRVRALTCILQDD